MENHALNIDTTYRQYADLLLAHHNLLIEGGKQDEQLEAVEDAMTELWSRLDQSQRASLSGIGSDLNWVRRGGKLAPNGRKRTDVAAVDMTALADAKKTGDHHALLHGLRMCAPQLAPLEIAESRADAYAALGFVNLADLFRTFGSEMGRSHGKIAV